MKKVIFIFFVAFLLNSYANTLSAQNPVAKDSVCHKTCEKKMVAGKCSIKDSIACHKLCAEKSMSKKCEMVKDSTMNCKHQKNNCCALKDSVKCCAHSKNIQNCKEKEASNGGCCKEKVKI